MKPTLAFDVYGTLITTHGVLTQLQSMVGDKAMDFSNRWREKQLEYSFRRGLMQNYVSFTECTRQALEYTCQYYQINLSAEQKRHLMACYKTLPAFDDVKPALSALKEQGYRLFAFSNGTKDAVETLLKTADIDGFFEGVVSADEIKTFKPNPEIYGYFLTQSHSSASHTWLISSNPFDVTGAISAGWKAAWIQRSPKSIFDPWEIEPTSIATSLSTLDGQIDKA
ncbi:haloacid dehalogenase type II [Shewanella olleyana]|uniref:haloacid dehalogenase type II n=1 Tax=Shewanella olleyana TaxID=135626 RepID=UPI00200D51E5|nr:haloacid dehalogenase type II [Shewanella olleyana]